MKKLLLTLALAFSTTAPALADEGDHSARLLALLRHPDQIVSQQDLQTIGAGEEALYAVASDVKLDRYARLRAASLLGYYPSSRLRLAALAEDPLCDVEVRIQAVASLVWIERAEAVPRLNVLLRDQHPQIRAAARRNIDRLSRDTFRTNNR